MAEKTNFSGLIEDQVTLPERCCGRCTHGKPWDAKGQVGGARMVLCKAGPPIPVPMMSRAGPMVVSQWPPMDEKDPGCDAFQAREEHNLTPGRG